VENERPTPLVEDIDGTRKKLEQWFARKLQSDGPVRIPELKIPETTGMSNVTLLFDIEYEKDGKTLQEGCVGRLQPEIERPVFPEYDLSIQYKAMDIVGSKTNVPAPGLLGLELDTSLLGTGFYIMKKSEGRVPPDMPPYSMDGWMLNEIGPQERESLWNAGIDTMANLHRQCRDYKALGFDFLERPELGANPLQQQLAYWENYGKWAMEGRPHPICDPVMQWLKDNQPKTEEFGLCWGDSRIGNMLFAEDCKSVTAVLDWEMITLGNPLQDLAWWNYLDYFFSDGLGIPRMEGLPSYEDTVARWEKASGFSGEHYTYYWVFAGLRYGYIMSRIMVAQQQEDQIVENFATTVLQKVMQDI